MERNMSFCYCLLALALIISTVSLVLNILVLSVPSILQREESRKEIVVSAPETLQRETHLSQQTQNEANDENVYVFAYDVPWEQYQYVTLDGELRGLSVDVIKRVCQEARKTCHHIVVPIKLCWNSEEAIGAGLLSGWFDACAVFLKTTSRDNVFKFSGRFYKSKMGIFYSKSTVSYSTQNLSKLTIGVRSHWYIGSNCLLKKNLKPGKIVAAENYEELYNMVLNDTVDMVFVEEGAYSRKGDLIGWQDSYDCSLGGSGVMHRIDSDLPLWFNPAFDTVKKLGIFRDLCDKYPDVKDNCWFD